jgi:riboflavin synthase
MFNGIIKNTGLIHKIIFKKNNCDIQITSKIKFSKKEIGSSISCSGTCLTLESFQKNKIKFYISKETINKTNFKYLEKVA